MAARANPQATPARLSAARGGLAAYDAGLMGAALLLIFGGLIMVASASASISARDHGGDALYYFWRQAGMAGLGLLLTAPCLKLPVRLWQALGPPLLLIAIVLLVMTVLPGLGREVNHGTRWLPLGPFALQVSEPARLALIACLAGYLARRGEAVRAAFTGFIVPVSVLAFISFLLLLQPDYGASVLFILTALGMLFLAGLPLGRFLAWTAVAGCACLTLAILSPYRLRRLLSFTDPWRDAYDSGLQLTQALIAFGRGEWFGVGLGGGVQKLFYLPEAHTDFLFAVLAEELGLIGSLAVILLYAFIVWRAFAIGRRAELAGRYFAAYFAWGIGLIVGLQAYINIGVNMGVLPTKGLTLPLMSYGGNSLIVYCLLLGILLRIDYENRHARRDIMQTGAPARV